MSNIRKIVMIVLVIGLLGLAYFVLTKGYSGNGINIAPILPNATPSSDTTDEPVMSDKISLTVTSPKAGETLDSTNATVKGKTVAFAEVFVNDQSGKADAAGNFTINVGLDEGDNQIEVSVNDSEGNVSQLVLNVTVVSF
jgi:hypothetical protein